MSMVSNPETGRGSMAAAHLEDTVGYRVEGPEGYLGLVQGVPQAGRPLRPLVLVVSDGETVRFVSLRRVAAVLPFEHRIALGPRHVASAPFDRAEREREAAA